MEEGKPVVRGYLCVIATATLWGISGTVAKILLSQGLSSFLLLQVRLTLASVLIGGYLALRRPQLLRIEGKDIVSLVLLGILGTALAQISYLYAINLLNVAVGVFLQYLSPVIVAGWMVLWGKERLGFSESVALVLAVAGCALMIGSQLQHELVLPWYGVLAGLTSAVALSFYNVYGKRVVSGLNSWTALTYSMAFGSIPFWMVNPPWHLVQQSFTVQQVIFLLYYGIFATAFPYGLFLVGLSYLRPSRASIVSTLDPVVAGLTAYLILGEVLTPWQIVGAVLIVSAVVTVQMERQPRARTNEVTRNRGYGPDKP